MSMTISIKQEEKTDCVAAVAAMLTNTSLREFKKIFGPPPELGYWNTDLVKYASSYGFFISDCIEKNRYRGKLRKNQQAYVKVVSERCSKSTHAIYWDGKKIYDPHPKVKNGRDIRTYDFINAIYFFIDKG